MYYLRPQGDDVSLVDDASDFESISKTMVLSTLMLTGQGGPSGKLPWYTQLVVLLTGIFSVAMFAIPASMLTWDSRTYFVYYFNHLHNWTEKYTINLFNWIILVNIKAC